MTIQDTTSNERDDEERVLPAPSWAQIHKSFPSRGFFALPCFVALARLGIDGVSDLARCLIVASPGTLGPEGAWRMRGHRIGAAQMFGAAPTLYEPGKLANELALWEERFPQAFEGPHFEGAMGRDLKLPAFVAMQGVGWTRHEEPNDPLLAQESARKATACLCFALAYPDLAWEHAHERGYERFASDLRADLQASTADWESRHIDRALPNRGEPSPTGLAHRL